MDDTCARFEHEWLHGDRDLARQLACEYVTAHEQRLATVLDRYSLEGLVTLIDGYREAGRHEDRLFADMWLLARYPQQHVTGAIRIGDGVALAQALSDAMLHSPPQWQKGGERL